jgi:hypothetical protein
MSHSTPVPDQQDQAINSAESGKILQNPQPRKPVDEIGSGEDKHVVV